MPSIKRALHYLKNDKARFLDSCVKNLGFIFSDKLYLSLRYRLIMGRWINWKNPKTFTEKIQWLKVYGYKPEYTQMVDKLAVKKYVASIIGQEYIIPTIGVWNSVDDIDWDNLPEQFVLKTTHGGGGTGVVVCPDKENMNIEAAKKKLSLSMAHIVGKGFREHPYYDVSRKVFAEKFISARTDDGKVLNSDLADYKFFCFNGEPKYCQVIRNRHIKETIDFYDMEWNLMPFIGLNPLACNGESPVARPHHLDKLIEMSRKLSKGIPFVRVDLYIVNNKEYFGELTFYPASGFGTFTPEDWDVKLGDCVKLQ